jgi:hypothetical protein
MTQEYRHEDALHSRNAEVEDDSFDELSKELASGAVSRGKALKLLGAAILGFGAASLFPGVAQARRRRGRRHHGRGGGNRRGICRNNQTGCNFGRCMCQGNSFCIATGFNDPGRCSNSSSRTCRSNEQGCNGGFCVCPGNTRCFVNSNNPQGVCL